MGFIKSYYRDENYRKVPVKLKIVYTDHAYKRLASREINRDHIEVAVKRGLSSIHKLKNNSNFKIYSIRHFLVIPSMVSFRKNKTEIYVCIKTIFVAPKASHHEGEKIIYS